MPRKRIFKDNAEKQSRYRERHLSPIEITRKLFESKLTHVQEIIKGLGYDYDTITTVVYPSYVKWWKKEYNVKIGLFFDTNDEKTDEIFSSVMHKLEGKVAQQSEYLDGGVTVHEMFWYILNFIGRDSMLNCNHCDLLFYIWEQECPKCHRYIKLMEEEENMTKAERIYSERGD